MAVKWAVANGNWSAGTTWNDGVVPTIDDDVYLNGHTITSGVNDISCRLLSNEACPNTGIAGGYIAMTANANAFINSNLEGIDIFEITTSTNNPITFVGDITLRGRLLRGIENKLKPINIIGNVDLSNTSTYVYQSRGFGLTITGNVIVGNYPIYERYTGQSGVCNLTITGNVTSINSSTASLTTGQNTTDTNNLTNVDFSNSNITLPNCNLNCENLHFSANQTCQNIQVANIIAENNAVLICNTLTIRSSITYKSTTDTMGVRYETINILNPDTFTWKDITTPRSNPFIILTDAEMNNRQQYPPENEVKEGTEYVWGEKVGTYQAPPESVVLKGYRYDNDEKEGTLENENIVGCVTPEDVRKDVPLAGMGIVGSLVVPSVDVVREGVIFDNGSVGTLIVKGGGDRLRIADFGYYTNAQSDTYIVDLTEQDKPKFAVAEERVLIEMFPDLDLDNIPDKYFDDLFVKFLKYRLIVEYYRTAGINSTFTPSEPTTEIVNYQNVRNEVWLNSANIYLKAWVKKYPDCITRPQRILL